MAQDIVFVKPAVGSRTDSVDLSKELAGGETITSVSSSVSPVSATPLVAVATVGSNATSILLNQTAGDEGVTYGTKLTVTTNLRTFTYVVATLVKTDIHVPYTTKNPYTYQTLIDSIEAGDAGIGKSYFVFPPATAVDGVPFIEWFLLDRKGTVFSNGNAYTHRVTNTSQATVIEANAVINVPSETPPSFSDERYQIRWELRLDPSNHDDVHYQFESVKVTGLMTVPTGAQPTIEMEGDPLTVSIVIDRPYENVGFEVFKGNTKVVNYTPVLANQRVSSGWYYTSNVPIPIGVPFQAGFDSYIVSWKYWNNLAPNIVQRENANLFVTSPTMIQAMTDVQRFVSKASTTLFELHDMIFSPESLLTFLKRGRDYFNGAAGMLTGFTMTNASGALREFWLRYSEVALLQAQYLAEGERAFNFQGQAISLDVDRTQYYSQLANELLSELNNAVKPLKDNLQIKGVNGGDGNIDGVATALVSGSMGAVGVMIHPASTFGRFWAVPNRF